MYRKAKAKGRRARGGTGGDQCGEGTGGCAAGRESVGVSSISRSSCCACSGTCGISTAGTAATCVSVAVETGCSSGASGSERCPGPGEACSLQPAEVTPESGPQVDGCGVQQHSWWPWRWWLGQGHGEGVQHQGVAGSRARPAPGGQAGVELPLAVSRRRPPRGVMPLGPVQVVVATGEAEDTLQGNCSPGRLSWRCALSFGAADGQARPDATSELRSCGSGMPASAGTSACGLWAPMSLPAPRPPPHATAPAPAPFTATGPVSSLPRAASGLPAEAPAPPHIPTPSPSPCPPATSTNHVSAPRPLPRPSPQPPTLVTCWCGPEAGYRPTAEWTSGGGSSRSSSSGGAEASDVEAASGSLTRASSSCSGSSVARAPHSSSACRLPADCKPPASPPAEAGSPSCGGRSCGDAQCCSRSSSSGGSSCCMAGACRVVDGCGPWAGLPGGGGSRAEGAGKGKGNGDKGHAADGGDAGPRPHDPAYTAYDRIPLLDHVFAAFPHVPVQASRGEGLRVCDQAGKVCHIWES